MNSGSARQSEPCVLDAKAPQPQGAVLAGLAMTGAGIGSLAPKTLASRSGGLYNPRVKQQR